MDIVWLIVGLAIGLVVGAGITAAILIMRMTKRAEEWYAIGVLGQIHVAGEIAGGRSSELGASIEEAIPHYLTGLERIYPGSSWRTDVLLGARAFYERAERPVPTEIETLIAGVQSPTAPPTCYDLLPACVGGPNCTPSPTSLRPVNLASPNPTGWVAGSGCGGTKKGKRCGAPLGIRVCI